MWLHILKLKMYLMWFCLLCYCLINPLAGASNRQRRIVNGYKATENYPWMVEILYYGRHNCGGSLIYPNWVLTAAHCIMDSYTNQNSVMISPKTRSEGQEIEIEEMHMHPNFTLINFHSVKNDIALLKLKFPYDLKETSKDFYKTHGISMYFNEHNTPCIKRETISLPQHEDYFKEGDVVVLGWGRTSYQEYFADTLMEAKLTIEDNSKCLQQPTKKEQMCANSPTPNVALCYGDSGGPAIIKKKDQYELVGISVDTADKCETFNVFTRVSWHIDWILKTVNSDRC